MGQKHSPQQEVVGSSPAAPTVVRDDVGSNCPVYGSSCFAVVFDDVKLRGWGLTP